MKQLAFQVCLKYMALFVVSAKAGEKKLMPTVGSWRIRTNNSHLKPFALFSHLNFILCEHPVK